MLCEHRSVGAYMESIKDYKEVLTGPNQFLSPSELRLGKGRAIKVRLVKQVNNHKVHCQVLTEEEHKHEQIFLGDLYEDKVFYRLFLGLRFLTLVFF
jgi:hypothetical protein